MHDTRRSGRIIPFAAALSLVPSLIIAWAVWDVHRLGPMVRAQSVAVEELLGRIDYLDEALTSSARLAAITGEARWETRYEALEMEVYAALDSLETVAATVGQTATADSIAAVADALAALEHRAMGLGRTGDLEGAKALLESPEYAALKAAYQERKAVLDAGLDRWVAQRQAAADERTLAILFLAAASLLILIGVWLLSTYLVRRQMGKRRAVERQLRHQVATQQRLEAEVRTAEERLRAIMDVAPVAIVRVGRDIRVQYWNRAAERIFGWTAEEVLGEPYPVRAATSRGEPNDLFSRGFAGESFGGLELERTRKDGSVVRVEMWNAPVESEDGTVEALVGVFADVTEQRSLQQRLRQAEKMEAIGRLAGGIAHDFNNVMTAVQGHADLLLEAVSAGDPLRQDMEEIRTNAGRATDLTRQLLAFSRRQVLRPRVLEPGAVVRGLEPMLRRLLGERIRLEIEGAAGTGRVEADPTQLEQVLINMAVNARDAMPDGGRLTIRLEDTDISEPEALVTEDEIRPGPYVRLAVADTGTGMDEGTLRKIFEPFFTTKDATKGTGLGLATVFGIVKQSGGYVRVESEPGRGTRFEILLPRVEKPVATTPPRVPPGPGSPGRGERILLVEDDDAVRSLAHRVLDDRGWRVTSTANPRDGLARVEAGELSDLDLLITDVVMPEMGGPELARRLTERFPSLPVIFMSGYTEDEMIREDIAHRSDTFLPKPFSPADLTAAVAAVLELRRRSEA